MYFLRSDLEGVMLVLSLANLYREGYFQCFFSEYLSCLLVSSFGVGSFEQYCSVYEPILVDI